jgi:hypothetical protein
MHMILSYECGTKGDAMASVGEKIPVARKPATATRRIQQRSRHPPRRWRFFKFFRLQLFKRELRVRSQNPGMARFILKMLSICHVGMDVRTTLWLLQEVRVFEWWALLRRPCT